VLSSTSQVVMVVLLAVEHIKQTEVQETRLQRLHHRETMVEQVPQLSLRFELVAVVAVVLVLLDNLHQALTKGVRVETELPVQ
jgi:hypothetical protein